MLSGFEDTEDVYKSVHELYQFKHAPRFSFTFRPFQLNPSAVIFPNDSRRDQTELPDLQTELPDPSILAPTAVFMALMMSLPVPNHGPSVTRPRRPAAILIDLSFFQQANFSSFIPCNQIFKTVTSAISTDRALLVNSIQRHGHLPLPHKKISPTSKKLPARDSKIGSQEGRMPQQNNIAVQVAVVTDQGRFPLAKEYDPHPSYTAALSAVTTTTEPGSASVTTTSSSPPSYEPPLATPLVTFISSDTDVQYCVLIQILPGYAFSSSSSSSENGITDHDFLRFTLFIDGVERVARTVSAAQIAAKGPEDPTWTMVIWVDEQGGHFVWKEIGFKDGAGAGAGEEEEEWDWDVGVVRVCVERMREGEEEEMEVEVEGNEEGEVEDEEMEDAADEEEGGLELHENHIEGRHLSHYTVFTDPEPQGFEAASTPVDAGWCVDGEPFLIFDIEYRSDDQLPLVAVMPW